MKLGIMFPYFMPYIGYWQLMNYVDCFVVYDNIEFEKSGWIRRNNILVNGQKKMFTIPIKKDSDYLNVDQRVLTEGADKELSKILRQIEQSYKRAPCYEECFPIIEQIFQYKENNLFQYIYHSIQSIREYIGIETPIVVSSTIDIEHSLKKEDKVMEICKKIGAEVYINTIGGIELYDKNRFMENGLELVFFESKCPPYRQFSDQFTPYLSIIDTLMFVSKDEIRGKMMREYTLL